MTEPDSLAVAATKRAFRTRKPADLEQARRLADVELPHLKRDIAESKQTINFMEAMMALMARHGAGPGNNKVTIADLVRDGKVSRADLQATGLPDTEIDQMYAALGLTG